MKPDIKVYLETRIEESKEKKKLTSYEKGELAAYQDILYLMGIEE